MSNFAFLQQIWPNIHEDCVRAESYLRSDPVAACFYARRAAEHLVEHLYTVVDLAAPYKDDLASRIHDPAFKTAVGPIIQAKLNLIRKYGNIAVHQHTPVTEEQALKSVTDLHHVTVYSAFHHSTSPDTVPTGRDFDPTLAARSAPLAPEELVALAQKFAEQDEAHQQALATNQALAEDLAAQNAELRAQIAEAQRTKTTQDHHDYAEAQTRTDLIDVLLHESGWTLDQAKDREFPVTGMPNQQGTGYVDYVLWGADGLPLAVVEAKRTTASPQHGQEQARLYADALEVQFGRRPIIYCSNGYEHWIWDDAAFGTAGDGYPPRPIQGFHRRDELELLIQRRQTRQPLAGAAQTPKIADRYYQKRAIAAVGKSFDAREREALLVMATGSGKTRTVIALVDQLMRANWVKRVLFLADRTALVNQAVNAFKEHLPSASPVNLVTERHAEGRVYASTYPTILNLINEVSDAGPGAEKQRLRRFGPGYFDLIVIDEAHRSIYQRYGEIFAYFDAHLVGLTATPKDEVDHNTYRLFHLEDGVPTDAYSLEEAVQDGYLVPPRGMSVGTRFLRQGITYAELPDEEKDAWDLLDWGEDGPPDAVDAEELNRFLFNEDTVDMVLATLMEDGRTVADGERLGKTIVFAKNQRHAEFIQQRFDAANPHLSGTFARVITHRTAYAQSILDDFTQPEKAPHIAISVDMLDTGIDVPEVVNLVFFKMVRSKTKFWQMIGRGTRLAPDLFGPGRHKEDFLVFDYCGNLEYFGQDLPGSEGSSQKSLTQRLFETRVALLEELDAGQSSEADGSGSLAGNVDERQVREDHARWLHEMVAGMHLENVIVRARRRHVEEWSQRRRWNRVTREDVQVLREHLAGLPTTVVDPDVDAKRFDLLVLRRELAQVEGDAGTAERIRGTVQQIAAALLSKTSIPSVAEQAVLLEAVAGDEWWTDVTVTLLELMRRRLRGLVRLIDHSRTNPVYTDFQDTLEEAVPVHLPQLTTGMDWERFTSKARAYLREHEDHVALQRLRRNKQLTEEDLRSLEEMLRQAGGGVGVEIERLRERTGDLGLFIRSLVGLERSSVVEAFAEFLDGTRFSADQVRFVNLIVDELTANGAMEPGRLYESPYTDLGHVDVLFPAEHLTIVHLLDEVRSRALSPGGVGAPGEKRVS